MSGGRPTVEALGRSAFRPRLPEYRSGRSRLLRKPRKAPRGSLTAIRTAAEEFRTLPDDALRARVDSLRAAAQGGAELVSAAILEPMFALVVEAIRRCLSLELYDVQLQGGLSLAHGVIAEMQTGEGKTLTAVLPACLHGLAGRGVHVMTVNPYLARRDFQLLKPVYECLGFSPALLLSDSSPLEKRSAYACDVTYGPGYEFGFDYLRDQVAMFNQQRATLGDEFRNRLRGIKATESFCLQRGHAFAVVDEADSVMIDEATTPLVLSLAGNEAAENTAVFHAARTQASQLEEGRDFRFDPTGATLYLTQPGIEYVAAQQGPLAQPLDRPWASYVEQALRAQFCLHRDQDYIVLNDEVRIVDQPTGRIFIDRSWRDGLQQAIQAKEGVTITREARSIARISRQRYLRTYQRLCGMTGTAVGSEREFRDVYGVQVERIPLHRPCLREQLSPRLFAGSQQKEAAIVRSISELHEQGRPVLVGTAAIEMSERLSRMVAAEGLPCQLLNGKQDADEAAIVSAAGRQGAITIATNMAGRGTDIRLTEQAARAGGLHVIVSEPQDSTRAERQLLGRAARQGDPGSSQLFAAADDRLFAAHDPQLATEIRARAATGEIRRPASLARRIRKLQRRVEQLRTQQRKQMFTRDDWLERTLDELAASG